MRRHTGWVDEDEPTRDVVELEVGPARMTLVPPMGGRIGRLRVFDHDLLVTATDVGGTDPLGTGADPMVWGSFPMAPWAGRVRHGRFTHEGREHRLTLNLPPHAIHGTVFDRRWSITRLHREPEVAEITLEVGLGPESGSGPGGWPFGGRALQEIRLEPHGVHCRLTVLAGSASMPAELGWHPWFVAPDDLSFAPQAMYCRDEHGITIDRRVVPAGSHGPFDDCFLNDRPATLVFGDLTVTLTSDADHWVLYDEPAHATCLEPQSGPPDAFTLRPRVLTPGERLERWMRLSWSTAR